MAALLRRLPSFRRSASATSIDSEQTQQSSIEGPVGDAKTSIKHPQEVWTVEEAKAHLVNLDLEGLRRLVADLADSHIAVREALQKHAQEHARRPGFPHASSSMNKKRRAEEELNRASDAQTFLTAVNELNPTKDVSIDGAGLDQDLPTKPIPNEEAGDKVSIKGQSGLVMPPANDAEQAANGAVDASATGAESGAWADPDAKTRKAVESTACEISFYNVSVEAIAN